MTLKILHGFCNKWIIEPIRETIKNRILDYFICWRLQLIRLCINTLFNARMVQLVFQFWCLRETLRIWLSISLDIETHNPFAHGILLVYDRFNCLSCLSLRKEGYSQAELDHLFSSIVLPSITYGLPVYGASEAELTAMQCFLDRCYKRKYTSKSFSIKHLLEKQDRKVFRKVSGIDRHPLRGLLPKKKVSTYNLRNRTSQYPKVNTDRFKNSYINRLIFKYNLAMWAYFFFIVNNLDINIFYSNIVT